MPTPAVTVPFAVYRGAKFEHALTIVDDNDDPVDLTGLNPFVCEFVHPTKEITLTTLSVANTDLASGVITPTATAEQTAALTAGIGAIRLRLKDAQDNPYIAATVPVEFFS